MRRIILSVLVITGITALAVGATGAYFSSTVSATNNNISSGSLSMTVNGSTNPSALFTALNMSPGGSNGWTTAVDAGGATIKNTGSITGDAWFDIENITVTGGINGDTSLANRVQPYVQVNASPWTHLVSGQSFNQLNGVKVDIGDIASGQSLPINIDELWPDSGIASDNLAQGETMTYNVVFHLDELQ